MINQSSHPHVTEKGEAFQLGQSIGTKGPCYAIIHYPAPVEGLTGKKESASSAVQRARIVSRVPCRSIVEPSYMHSFSITESYFVLIEQPLSVSLKTVLGYLVAGKPLVHALNWRQNRVGNLISKKQLEYFIFIHGLLISANANSLGFSQNGRGSAPPIRHRSFLLFAHRQCLRK